MLSCDKYADLWTPFFQLFRRFWPDCPFPVYLVSNRLRADIASVHQIQVGADLSWSDTLATALRRLDQPYVLLVLDDLFLLERVPSGEVVALLAWMIDSGANHLRLHPPPLPDKPHDARVGIVSPGALYRTSTQFSAWRKSAMLELLVPGESAWDFEISGSGRSDRLGGFYSTWRPSVSIVNGVIKGKWRRDALKRVRALGADVDLAARPLMTPSEAALFRLKRVRSRLLLLLPAPYQRRVRDLLLQGRL